MANIFTNQKFRLRLKTQFDLSGVVVKKVLYQKPNNGGKGFWTPTIEGNDFIFTVTRGIVTIPGVWTFQAYAEESDGESIYGTIDRHNIEKPIS